MTTVTGSLSGEGLASAGPFALCASAQALEDAAVRGDRADHDRLRRHICTREDDAAAQLGAVSNARAVTEHERPHQAHAGPDLNVVADPRGALDRRVLAQRRASGDDHPRAYLLTLDLQVQLAAERVEGPLSKLAQRADVVPVLTRLVDVKRDIVLEQGREHVLRPVGERTLGEVVKDGRIEHVDAAVAEV